MINEASIRPNPNFGGNSMRTVYLNGNYVPETEALVSIFDRGFLFADGVYEVTTVVNGKLIGFEGHKERLRRSLKELSMSLSMTDDELLDVHRELVRLNAIDQGLIYLQITRGNPGDRDFAYPPKDTPATVVLFTQEKQVVGTTIETNGLIAVVQSRAILDIIEKHLEVRNQVFVVNDKKLVHGIRSSPESRKRADAIFGDASQF